MSQRDELPPQVPGYEVKDLERLSIAFAATAQHLSRPDFDLALPPQQANVLDLLLACREAVEDARMVEEHGNWLHVSDEMVRALLEAMGDGHWDFCQVLVEGTKHTWEAGQRALFLRVDVTLYAPEPIADGRYVVLRRHLVERRKWDWKSWAGVGGAHIALNLDDRTRCERVPCLKCPRFCRQSS